MNSINGTQMSRKINLELEPADTERLANLCGQFDEHLKQIESRLQVDIFCRGNLFTIQGETRQARAASRLLKQLYKLSDTELLSPEVINLHLQDSGVAEISEADEPVARGKPVEPVETQNAVCCSVTPCPMP